MWTLWDTANCMQHILGVKNKWQNNTRKKKFRIIKRNPRNSNMHEVKNKRQCTSASKQIITYREKWARKKNQNFFLPFFFRVCFYSRCFICRILCEKFAVVEITRRKGKYMTKKQKHERIVVNVVCVALHEPSIA